MTAPDLHIDARDEHRQLEALFGSFERLAEADDATLFARDTTVSGWSVAQHLFHVLKADGMMLKAAHVLTQGAGEEGQSLSEAGRQVLAEEKMPRGQYDAPDNVQPADAPSRDDIRSAFRRSHQKVSALEPLLDGLSDVTGRFPQPFMGPLSAVEWLRTARIHAEHHLGIVREITGEASAA